MQAPVGATTWLAGRSEDEMAGLLGAVSPEVRQRLLAHLQKPPAASSAATRRAMPLPGSRLPVRSMPAGAPTGPRAVARTASVVGMQQVGMQQVGMQQVGVQQMEEEEGSPRPPARHQPAAL